jgi:hypothetical protein
VNEKGEVVALPHSVGDQYGTHEDLLYLRKDLVEQILKKARKKFLVVTWGERQYWPENFNDIHRPEYAEIMQNYRNIYKKVFIYPFLI